MTEVNLRHIRYFVAVAEEGHFGRAAERVGIAQPPLTQQIQKLEQILGERLFERRPRVRLTAAGEAFLEGALKVIAQVNEAVADTHRAASGASGSLTLGFAASTLLTIMPEAVRRYRDCYPSVHLKLLEMSSASQIAALSDGDIDLGFLRQPAREFAHLRCELSFSEPFGVVVPSGHRLSGRESIALKELAQDEFVLFPQSVAPSLHGQVMELFYRAGFAPRVVQEAQEWLTIVGLVDAGVGLSIVPSPKVGGCPLHRSGGSRRDDDRIPVGTGGCRPGHGAAVRRTGKSRGRKHVRTPFRRVTPRWRKACGGRGSEGNAPAETRGEQRAW